MLSWWVYLPLPNKGKVSTAPRELLDARPGIHQSLVFWKVIENSWLVAFHCWWGPVWPVSCGWHHLIDSMPTAGPSFCCPWSHGTLRDHGLHLMFLLPISTSITWVVFERSQPGSPMGPWPVVLHETISIHWTKSFLPLLPIAHSIWEEFTLSSTVCMHGRGRDGIGVGGQDFPFYWMIRHC